MIFRRVTHVIFDLDGLLIDSESIFGKVMTDIVKSFGKKFLPDLKLRIMGASDEVTAKTVIKELQLPLTPDGFHSILSKKMSKYLENVKLMPGAERLVEHLHNHRIAMSVATSARQEETEFKTRNYPQLMRLFHHVISGSSDPEVKSSKPAPDIFLISASRFEDAPNPQQCLVFEDSPAGVRGAKKAGMQVVMVPSPIVPPESRKEATLVLNSLEEFQPELFGLPPFNKQ